MVSQGYKARSPWNSTPNTGSEIADREDPAVCVRAGIARCTRRMMLGSLTQMGVLGRHLSEVMSQLRGERVARQRGRGGPGGRNSRAKVEQ